MSVEYEVTTLKVVDEHNQVIGSMPDTRLRDSPQERVRAVVVLITTPDNQLLIQKRSKKKYIYPQYWDNSVGGMVEAHQTEIDCALQELDEEVGLQLSEQNITFHSINYIKHQFNEYVYYYHYQTEKFTPQTNWEVSETKWVSLEVIKKMIAQGEKFTPACKKGIKIIYGEQL